MARFHPLNLKIRARLAKSADRAYCLGMVSDETILPSTESGWMRLRLRAEASVLLAVARATVALVPFRLLARHLSAPGRPRGAPRCPEQLIVGAVAAIETMSRRLPFRTVCFQKGLALHWMIRRRGIGSLLHFGAALEGETLSAHVWVSVEGLVVIGGETATKHICLAQFPGSPPTTPEKWTGAEVP